MWWMLLGGGIAWFIQFLVLYLLAEFGGVAGWHERLLLGVDMVSWGVLSITVAALAVAGWCGWLAKRASQEFRELEPSTTEATPIELDTELPAWKGVVDPHFLVQSAVVGNAIFAFIIVAQTLPVFFF